MVASAQMRFAKYEGLGNDFVLIDRDELTSAPFGPDDVRALCDRHRGVGADGVLIVGRDPAPLPIEGVARVAQLSMQVLNADGSTSEMCGNGLRCVVLFAAARGWMPAAHARVQTGAGLLAVELLADGQIEADMGHVELRRAHIPMLGDGDPIDVPIDVAGLTVRVSACALGNPHAVTFDALSESERALVGPALEVHPLFPARVNVGFASSRDAGRAIDLAVWERGVGFTQACGTGACAAAVAAVRSGRAGADQPIAIHLPGGVLSVVVAADASRVRMRGPARHVFSGEIDVTELSRSCTSSSAEGAA